MIPKNLSSVGLIPLRSASPGFLFFSPMLISLTRSLNSSNLAFKASRICEEPVVLGPPWEAEEAESAKDDGRGDKSSIHALSGKR